MTAKQKRPTRRDRIIAELSRWLDLSVEAVAEDVRFMTDADLIECYGRLAKMYGLQRL